MHFCKSEALYFSAGDWTAESPLNLLANFDFSRTRFERLFTSAQTVRTRKARPTGKSVRPRRLRYERGALVSDCSERCSDPAIDGKRHARQERSRIVEREQVGAARRRIVETGGVEEGARGVIVLVEQVLHQPEDLHVL